MYRIYIVEDDSMIAGAVGQELEKWGYAPQICRDFHNILGEFAAFSPHLVLMDISLPFRNGYFWCGELRRVSKVPIIFLSSASDNLNMVMAMNMGADDFIPKPFDMEILTAKVQALLRRTYDFSESVPILEHRGALLNTADGTFVYEGNQIPLSKNEYRILSVLMQNRDRVVSREKLMKALWVTDVFVDENTLTVNVGRLRKKLENAGLPDFIETKFGVGYRIGGEGK